MWLCTHVLFFSFLKCRFDEVNDSGLEEPEGYGDIALQLISRSPGDKVKVRARRDSGGGKNRPDGTFKLTSVTNLEEKKM